MKAGVVVALKKWKHYFHNHYKNVSTKGWLSLTDSRNLCKTPPECTYKFHRSYLVQFADWQPFHDAAEDENAQFEDAREEVETDAQEKEAAAAPQLFQASELKMLKWDPSKGMCQCNGCGKHVSNTAWYGHFFHPARQIVHRKGKFCIAIGDTEGWHSKTDYFEQKKGMARLSHKCFNKSTGSLQNWKPTASHCAD